MSEKVHTLQLLHSVFPDIRFIQRTNYDPNGTHYDLNGANYDPNETIRTRQIHAIHGVLESENCAVAAKLCLKRLVGHLRLRKG